VTYTALIDAYARTGNARRSEEILRQMISSWVADVPLFEAINLGFHGDFYGLIWLNEI